ncbi:50S ribosomal protein L21 (macronuclear) [Tetrahymena thermophila SB210]|uniref:Large ribosomal subunit protein bL21m n=1 Tax=Tetrahymena thermophila (strain SB210) TaxID=312017 RepID=I7LVD3_TETTS|nr:50S ribosomal protein L21 [Tetrahymena thermophila SB210]EAR97909.2 50S ribosomal protein L21 [Tetrahymena thermophila SB210]6Z1P_Av Chain Av, 50S ribosomal protein L21 [Tetrahymena thermophila SB210]|eukprot:XP_001018154.2 50S ribosomal protein L21 [Tetrahymena thermophila SB210]
MIIANKLFSNLAKTQVKQFAFHNYITAAFGRAKPKVNHHTPFEEKDYSELKIYDDERLMDKQYKRIRDEYQKAAVKKEHRRERIEQIKAERPEIPPEDQKLVIHDPQIGIQYPAIENQIFAVVEILGFQYKVAQDDILTIDWLSEYDINDQVVFDNVLLVGTTDYTSIGRPYISTAKVYATVEEQTQGEKVLGLHMRRRKTSRKSWGHRQKMTVLRIDRIEHNLGEKELTKAVSL